MGGLNSKQIADIKKGKTDVLTITNQRKDHLQKKIYSLTSTRSWNVSNNFLTSLSPRISSLTLTSLNLSSNEFVEFPPVICALSCLAQLDLSFNFIADVPSEIQQLTSLTELNISFNKLSKLPMEIGHITTLQTLKITNNFVEKVPDTFAKLHNLKYLHLSHNNIMAFPKFTPSLEELNLSSNHIIQVPNTFLLLSTLRVLSLSRNHIHVFPPPNTTPNPNNNLREVHINNNHLKELHKSIYLCTKLEILDLKGNDLKELPSELFVYSPLIHNFDISFNLDCKWGMQMPSTFAEPPLVREIHLAKNQRIEEIVGDLSDSPNGSPTTRQSGGISSAVASEINVTPSATNVATSKKSSFNSNSTASLVFIAATTAASTTSTTTTTTVIPLTDGLSLVDGSVPPFASRAGPDEPPLKRKHTKHVKKYLRDQKRLRVVEHDYSVVDMKGIASHAAHLAELMVWSGATDCENVEEEIKKVLLDITCIRPGLFLSSKYGAQDRDALHAKNITHILVVGTELAPNFPGEFDYHVVRVKDNSITEDLSMFFPICQKFIDTGRKKGGVLVHCAAGVSRSASVVMAYLMWSENMTFSQARKELKTLRPIVKSNFYLQLEFYASLLKAQSKRKSKQKEKKPKPPKIVRTTSLPTIIGNTHFKISMDTFTPDADHHPATTTTTATTSPTASPITRSPSSSISSTTSPMRDLSPASALGRSALALYATLKKATPSRNVSPKGMRRVGEKVGGLDGNKVGVGEGDGGGKDELSDMIIREASDYEEVSEIHKLMRVHSLPELYATISKGSGKSFLRNARIAS